MVGSPVVLRPNKGDDALWGITTGAASAGAGSHGTKMQGKGQLCNVANVNPSFKQD